MLELAGVGCGIVLVVPLAVRTSLAGIVMAADIRTIPASAKRRGPDHVHRPATDHAEWPGSIRREARLGRTRHRRPGSSQESDFDWSRFVNRTIAIRDDLTVSAASAAMRDGSPSSGALRGASVVIGMVTGAFNNANCPVSIATAEPPMGQLRTTGSIRRRSGSPTLANRTLRHSGQGPGALGVIAIGRGQPLALTPGRPRPASCTGRRIECHRGDASGSAPTPSLMPRRCGSLP